MTTTTTTTFDNTVDRKFPPIAWMTTGALGLIIIGGILMAAYAPRKAPLGLVTTLAVAAWVLLASGIIVLSRQKDFAWGTFRRIFKWAFLAYIIEAGVIEFAFVRDYTRGTSLVLVTLMLVVFSLSPPATIAFTAARYADPNA